MEPTTVTVSTQDTETTASAVAAPVLSIVVPTKNESASVGLLLARLESVLPDEPVEVIFVDESDDGTPEAVEHAARKSSRAVSLIHRPASRRTGGLGTAVVEGMHVARAPWICVMDADLQHPPEIVEQLVGRAAEDDVDIVVASRFCDGGGIGNFGRMRRALSKSSSSMAAMFFRSHLRRVSDPMSGFFLVRRDSLDLEALQPHGFKILLEVLVRTSKLRAAEVAFTFGVREAGESKASVQEASRYLVQLWRLRFGEFFLRFGRFGLVGATGLVVNTALLAVLTDVAGIYYLAAAVLATQGSTLWNFTLTELWVFSNREHARKGTRRMAMFFLVNNAALGLRIPLLALLVGAAGMNLLVANVISLGALFVARFAVADVWIWAKSRSVVETFTAYNYDLLGANALPARSPRASATVSRLLSRWRVRRRGRASFPQGAAHPRRRRACHGCRALSGDRGGIVGLHRAR